MMAALEDALDYGQRVQKERDDPQMGLFSMGGESPVVLNAPVLPEIEEWEERQRLTYEKESLGFYISGHPLRRYEALMEKFTNADTLSISDSGATEAVRIGGMVRSTKVIRTRKGDLMAFVTLEDMNGSVEITVFSSLYATAYELLFDDSAVFVEGQVQREENVVKIIAETVVDMEKVEEKWTAAIRFRLNTPGLERQTLEELRSVMERHPGNCSGYLHLVGAEGAETVIELPESLRMRMSRALRRDTQQLLGYNAVEPICMPAATSNGNGNGGFKNGRRGRNG
jgi:DNA polymerase-3 subunit alpha